MKAELGDLRDKLRQALVKLRKSKPGRKHLYELPWYVMIGPPGAGKTTAIVNSGLQFPLADDMGKGAIGGVGGTRNCDWWFTENAVLIDTAGRYTTQESDAVHDNGAWLGFLNLLKKHRSRQPINGAIVAISLSATCHCRTKPPRWPMPRRCAAGCTNCAKGWGCVFRSMSSSPRPI